MSYYPQNNNVPFNPDAPDQQNIATSTPRVNVDLGQLANFTIPIIDTLVTMIQSGIGRNPARTFAFNFWAENFWNNRQFVDLMALFAAHVVTVIENQGGNIDPEQVIRGEAEWFLDAAVAGLFEQFPGLGQWMQPDSQCMRNWQQLISAIRQAHRQRDWAQNSQRQQGYGGGYQGYGNQQPRPSISDLRPVWDDGQQGIVTHESQTRVKVGLNSGLGIQGETKSYSPSPNERTVISNDVPRKDPPQMARYEKTDMNAPKPVIEGTPKSAELCIRLENGRVMKPAISSGMKAMYSPMSPPIAFNRLTHALFHVIGEHEGRTFVSELIQERTVEMDYLSHELDSELRKIYKNNLTAQNRAEEEVNLAAVRTLTPSATGTTAVYMTQEKRNVLIEAGAPAYLSKTIAATSLKAARASASLELLRAGNDTHLVEYRAVIIEDYVIVPKARQKIEALRLAHDYRSLHTAMEGLLDSSLIESKSILKLYDAVNQRLTREFNRWLQKVGYFTFTVDEFYADYPDAEKLIRGMGEKIYEMFKESFNFVVTRALEIADLDDPAVFQCVNAMASTIFSNPDVDGDSAAKVQELINESVYFTRVVTVTHVPWQMYDMEKQWRLEGLVDDQNAHQLHRTLKAIYARQMDPEEKGPARTASMARDHILISLDDHVLYTYAAAMRSPDIENFSVTLVPPSDQMALATSVSSKY